MPDDPKPPPAPVPLGAPIRLSAAADVLVQVTRADVQAAQAYWAQHATGLPDLLAGVLVQAETEGAPTNGE